VRERKEKKKTIRGAKKIISISGSLPSLSSKCLQRTHAPKHPQKTAPNGPKTLPKWPSNVPSRYFWCEFCAKSVEGELDRISTRSQNCLPKRSASPLSFSFSGDDTRVSLFFCLSSLALFLSLSLSLSLSLFLSLSSLSLSLSSLSLFSFALLFIFFSLYFLFLLSVCCLVPRVLSVRFRFCFERSLSLCC